MSSSLALVRARRVEIANRLDAINVEAKALGVEDADLAVTERTLERLEGKPEDEMVPVSQDPLADKFSDKKPSIKQLIVRALSQSPEAWVPDAGWVWNCIRQEFGVEINKNSFFPQMHSLVNEDKAVIRDGKRVALRERLSFREIREIANREAAQ